MSDPFADLLNSLKNEGNAAKKDDLKAVKASRKDTESPSLPRISSPEIRDDFNELFGLSMSSKPPQVTEDGFDAAFKAFDGGVEDEDRPESEAEMIVDEVKDMEVAKLMSLDLTIEEATSYYDRGILYEELVRKQREKEAIRAQKVRTTAPLKPEQPAGFFGVASGLLERGRQFVDQLTTFPEEQNRLSCRLREHNDHVDLPRLSQEAPSVVSKPVEEELPAKFTETLLLDDEPSPMDRRSPTPPPEGTLLDFDDEDVMSQKVASSVTPVPISQLELSGYTEFKDRATDFFKAGDYVSASIEYEKSLNSLPQEHALRIVAYSNLVAALLKIGEYKRCISDTDVALELLPEEIELWNQAIPNTEPRKTYKEMWSKIMARRAEAFEHLECYREALNSYQSLIEKSCFNDKIMEGKRRCQRALNPPERKSAPPKKSPVPKSTNMSSVLAPAKEYASVQRVKDDNRKEEALEAEKAALYDKVFGQVEAWKGTKGDDIRHLLANLSQVLTWCDWKAVSTSDLVMPKRVKITYMKAVAKTHPDKVPATLELEKKMLAENVFSLLSVAWEKFKSENNIN